ncbi:hypothetical protein OHA25_55885 [Nonomuraea sp. NBC_00507]|uniref:quinone oxidoreductase family protein n=1 Tax=Nonomuraea sp. NBC_00507 TaxID=2976002 RepID=UPI002E195524
MKAVIRDAYGPADVLRLGDVEKPAPGDDEVVLRVHAGEIEAVGAAVTRFKPGDRVFGTCDGAFAEFARTPQDRLAPIPENLTFERAAALPTSGMTALMALRDAGKVRPGQRVLVIGAGGGVGTFAM